MTDWKTICLFCLTGTLCCVLAPTYASPPTDTKVVPKTGPSASFASPVTFDPQEVADTTRSLALIKQGDASLDHSNWKVAQQEYQEALDLWPRSLDALYGLAKCNLAAGDQAKAVAYYRQAVYSDNPADKGFRENNTSRLMEFALLLNKTGQTAEAMFVYNHAAHALDYQDSDNRDGKPTLKVLFPEIVMERTQPQQVRYTPERLQALADVMLAYKQGGFWSDKEVLSHAQEAVKLYPDCAAVQYYFGESVHGSLHRVEVKAAYKKAVELGDEATVAAAKERLAGLP